MALWRQRTSLCAAPASGVGSFNGSLLFCFRKDVALVSHCGPGKERGTGNEEPSPEGPRPHAPTPLRSSYSKLDPLLRLFRNAENRRPPFPTLRVSQPEGPRSHAPTPLRES